MKNSTTQHELEHIFAQNFSSPIFPMLADCYYKQKIYSKALKVCEIGLQHNPHNILGQYIIAKIMLIENQPNEAEKLLKQIIFKDSDNVNAILTLIAVELKLKRSKKTIEKYILHIDKILPESKTIKKLNNIINIKKIKTKNPPRSQNLNEALKRQDIDINATMATKTMYKIIKKQKKYNLAKQILKKMIINKQNVSFATKEIKNIKSLIKNKGIN